MPTAALAGALAGATGIAFLSATMTALQLHSIPVMRGRVMALYSILFLGSTPIGGPLGGWIAQAFGTRWSIAMGAAAPLASGVAGLRCCAGGSSRGAGASRSAPCSRRRLAGHLLATCRCRPFGP